MKLKDFVNAISENGKHKVYSLFRDGLLFFRRDDDEIIIYGGVEENVSN